MWQLRSPRRRRVVELGVRTVRGVRPQLTGLARRAWRSLARRLRDPLIQVPTTLPRPLPELTVPPMTDPDGVSIVIPVMNHAAVTYQCLRTIVQHTAAGGYEIILVDNGSDDATRDLPARIRGVRVIRNETNLGYGPACNQGAAEARGAFLLFLNNDAFPLAGWLEPLRAVLAEEPTVGAVGPQLLYPDRRLQEAGAILWQDGRGWNYGRNDDPRRSPYRHRRDVDYCSAACLLVRRSVFERVGGFDPRFSPAYYEDADLCLEIARLGYRVVYQPAARVVHVEGLTAGHRRDGGFKRFQGLHRARFVEKHAATLATRYP